MTMLGQLKRCLRYPKAATAQNSRQTVTTNSTSSGNTNSSHSTPISPPHRAYPVPWTSLDRHHALQSTNQPTPHRKTCPVQSSPAQTQQDHPRPHTTLTTAPPQPCDHTSPTAPSPTTTTTTTICPLPPPFLHPHRTTSSLPPQSPDSTATSRL